MQNDWIFYPRARLEKVTDQIEQKETPAKKDLSKNKAKDVIDSKDNELTQDNQV